MSIISLPVDANKLAERSQHTYFISDLHLDPARPETIELSLRFLAHVQGAQALFIIGDLFEYWLGDDAADPRLTSVFDAMKAVSASGTAMHLMHGNRDFLLGEQFAASVGAKLHRDDHIEVDFGIERYSLVHGDTLCTDDVDYLQLRGMLRNPAWQSEFLALSIDERIAKAQALRDQSRNAVANKSAGIMDVNKTAVQAHCAAHKNDALIHGHTHRPLDHSAKSAAIHRRLVLGDWKTDHAMIARFDGQQLFFERYS